VARAIDGDTIAVGSRHVRLQGIDAPETDQVCLDAQGERWTCGITAREHLSAHIAGRAVTEDDARAAGWRPAKR
jgi:endonuclease YncB( thermonuclease family)